VGGHTRIHPAAHAQKNALIGCWHRRSIGRNFGRATDLDRVVIE
jgi:hypothetical protein